MRALALAFAFALTFPGCVKSPDARANLVPYPKLGDSVAYDVTGAYVEFARWENAHPLTSATKLRFDVAAAGSAVDAARLVVPTYKVTTTLGGVKHAELYVSPAHDAIVQAYLPLSQDQSIVAFDERGYPWLFGASALFGRELKAGARVAFEIPDGLGLGRTIDLAWVVERADASSYHLRLEGNASIAGALDIDRGSPWPRVVDLTLKDNALAPLVRADAPLPATMHAVRGEVRPGSAPLAPRDASARFGADAAIQRVAWDGEKPPDGNAGYIPYLLSDAVRDAKLLDKGLADWSKAAQDPRLYRATYKDDPNPLNVSAPGAPSQAGAHAPYWLLQFVDQKETYYGVEIERVEVPAIPAGAPRVLSSGSVDRPSSTNHGWFAKDALPKELVPLSEGVRVMKTTFGATQVQIFLRSFARPPGYSYFIDGGWEKGESGRYTVVYNPETGLLEEATGPVTPRLAN